MGTRPELDLNPGLLSLGLVFPLASPLTVWPLGCPLGRRPQPLGAVDTGFDRLFLSLCTLPQLFESLQVGDYLLSLSRPAAAYEEALQLVKEGKVLCRTLR